MIMHYTLIPTRDSMLCPSLALLFCRRSFFLFFFFDMQVIDTPGILDHPLGM
jgi:hypothetical protein